VNTAAARPELPICCAITYSSLCRAVVSLHDQPLHSAVEQSERCTEGSPCIMKPLADVIEIDSPFSVCQEKVDLATAVLLVLT